MAENNSIIGIVDRTKARLRQTSDDSSFSDKLVYATLLDVRNDLIYKELNKYKRKSKFLFKTLCMPLELASDIPCDCIPEGLGCTALKSKYELPLPLRDHMRDFLIVTTLDGSVEISYREPGAGRYNKYSRLGRTAAYFTIYNNFLYIIGWPNNSLKAVKIDIIPQDPTDLDDISLCDENGNNLGETCFDPIKDTFNIDGHLVGIMIDMTLERLAPTLQLPEDLSNNSNSIPEQIVI
jgi:hypothetical protein